MGRRLAGCGFFSLIIGIMVTLGTSVAHAQAAHGILKVVKGDVKIVQASDGKTIDARIGGKVLPKDVIITAKDSRAKVVMVDNNEINISPDTKFEIKSYEYKPEDDKKNVLLNVMYGTVRAKVNQHYEGDNKFQVKTPGAVAGVRGTDFITSFDPSTQASNVVTFSGKVAFGQPGAGGQINNAVMVGAGQSSGAGKGAVPSTPANVPKQDLAKMDNDSDSSKDHHGDHNDGDKRQPAGSKSGANASPAGGGMIVQNDLLTGPPGGGAPANLNTPGGLPPPPPPPLMPNGCPGGVCLPPPAPNLCQIDPSRCSLHTVHVSISGGP